MRKVTQQTAEAFDRNENKAVGNSVVVAFPKQTDYYLHGNLIAWKGRSLYQPHLSLTLAGWGTATTRDRLNGILQTLRIPLTYYQSEWEQYIRNYSPDRSIALKIDGEPVTLAPHESAEVSVNATVAIDSAERLTRTVYYD